MKKAFLDKRRAEEIAARFPTPFHVYDEEGIIKNAEAVNKAFAWNKGFKEYFAVKATPNPFILKVLKECGCGRDCSSMAELRLAQSCGFKDDEIMFSSNDTPASEFAYAQRLGSIINFDDLTLIDYYAEHVGSFPETMCCRYNPGGVFTISNQIMDNPNDAKYGFTRDQLFEGFKKLKEKGVRHFGIHSFLVSNTVSNDYYPMLAKQLFELAVDLKKTLDVHIAFINLSGGVGVPYTPEAEPNDIAVIGEGVRKQYEEILTPEGMDDVAIYTEMGRFMLAPYGALVTRAIHEKHIYKEYIGVDACAADLMRPAMYGAYHHITVLGKEDAPLTNVYDVTGSLCENNDKFAVDRKLPKIDIGDLLYIHDTGAHGHAMGYNYNGRLRSAEIMLHKDGSFDLIRRAETLEDYFATFDCFEIGKQLAYNDDLFEKAKSNPYPGRGIVIGRSGDGKSAVIAYFIMGRSENSRNRIFVEDGEGIRTQAFDPSKMKDPSLIIYSPVRVLGKETIVTNGDQTDTIYEGLEKGLSFEEALRSRKYEPDEPNFTPRISGIVKVEDGALSYKMSILKANDTADRQCLRQTFEYEAQSAGVGSFLHTYKADGKTLLSFEGEPERVELCGDIDTFTDCLWESLNEDNKVSLFVRYIDIETGKYETRIKNKNK